MSNRFPSPLLHNRPAPRKWIEEAKFTGSREDVITEYVSSGTVLDLGVVDGRRAFSAEENLENFSTSLHEHIRRLNPSVVGVDYDAHGVQILKQHGYNVVCADVESMDLKQQFDTVVGGEIIEHLPNPGRALATIRKHLKPSGRLILTTCNPFFIRQVWNILRYNNVRVHEEHTAWFDPHTIGWLLWISGYEIEQLYWLGSRRLGSWYKAWPAWLRSYFNPHFLVVAKSLDRRQGPDATTVEDVQRVT